MSVQEWPIYRHMRSVAVISIAIIVLFILLLPTGIVEFYLDNHLHGRVSDSMSDGIGLGINVILVGFILSIFTATNTSRYSNQLAEWVASNYDSFASEQRRAIALHILYYSTILGISVIISTVLLHFGISAVDNRIAMDTNLTEDQITATISLLEITGILLPAWIAFINIGMREYRRSNSDQNPISPRVFTSVAVIGYLALLLILLSTSWTLLPILPPLISWGLVLMNVILTAIGVRINRIDQRVLDQVSEVVDDNEEESLRGYY